MSEPAWKTITIPKMVYMPTGNLAGAFKDTGLRVEPTDKVEILPGSRLIRVNGVEHRLLIPADNLPLDAQNCLRLDKPAPPVGNLGAMGNGRAYVGRVGQAAQRAQADNFWSKDLPKIDPRYPVDPEDEALFQDTPKSKTASGFDPTIFHETRHTKTVTLRDGSTVEVLVDEHGREAGYRSRTYSGIGTDPKEAARMLAEQNSHAVDVTHHAPQMADKMAAARNRIEDRQNQPSESNTPRREAAPKAISTGFRDLDGLLGATTGCQGLPAGSLSYFYGDTIPPGASVCASLEAAFAKIHFGGPLILVHLTEPNPPDQLRLAIAEQLPVLAEAIKSQGQVAVAICSPDWQAQTPALLNYIPSLSIRLTTHDRDDRFLTATITKGATGQPAVSFPR